MPSVLIPAVPDSLNDWSRGSAHWTIRTAARDRWRDLFALYAAKSPRLVGPVRVTITFYMPTRRRADANNRVKFVLDAAVHVGLIPDDGPPWLVEETYRARHDPLRPRTVFEYEQADAPAWPVKAVRKR